MSDFILLDNDQAIFDATFGDASVTPEPGTLTASGPANADGKKMCVAGDESTVKVPGCSYSTKKCTISGAGTLTISSLAGDQKTAITKCGGKALLLKGSQFKAEFSVNGPAQQPSSPNPIPDAVTTYTGNGTFTTTNAKYKAS